MSAAESRLAETLTELSCYHCKQPCEEEVWHEGKVFCCNGCKTVFEILSENNLCDYYALDGKAGIQLRSIPEESFDYLDQPAIRKKVMEFDSDSFGRIRLLVPAIHCISCIWLLENLHKIEQGVLKCEVNFSNRKVCIDFNPTRTSAGKIAQRLASLGYTPRINLDNESAKVIQPSKSIVFKLAVAGFAFANIMLLSFPEYLGLDDSDSALRTLFSYLNIALVVPVVVYSANEYFINAWKSFSQKQINIDVPIAAGLIALFSRSLYDILTHTGPGYLDSLSGLVFFLLIGRWFQGKTYETLAFDRDYKSYFPLAVQKQTNGEWVPVIIYDLQIDDRIKVRNHEVIPADSTLLTESAFIDYSFVTGESKPTKVNAGSLAYAGGRLIGQPVELRVVRKTSQGHLTSIWNNPIFLKTNESVFRKSIDVAARRFTWVVMVIALITSVVWYIYDPSRVWLVLTSVLMVACPCALALAAPFTFGSFLRDFGRNKLYLKNADVVERMGSIDAVVFDKTGTVTYGSNSRVDFVGALEPLEAGWVKTLTGYSTHPLSKLITRSITAKSVADINDFTEYPGQGIAGRIGGHSIKIGSGFFVGEPSQNASVFVSIDGETRGYFDIAVEERKDLKQMLSRLGDKCVALISGDNSTDLERMSHLFPKSARLIFNLSPADKMQFISGLQRQGKKVMMVGDGLNDAGALKQSDVGIAVTDDTAVFTPASDGILQGDAVQFLDKFLILSKYSSTVLKTAFAISFLYNAIALTVAVTGNLTPLVAAILMPISSISVVGFSSLTSHFVVARSLKADLVKS